MDGWMDDDDKIEHQHARSTTCTSAVFFRRLFPCSGYLEALSPSNDEASSSSLAHAPSVSPTPDRVKSTARQ